MRLNADPGNPRVTCPACLTAMGEPRVVVGMCDACDAEGPIEDAHGGLVMCKAGTGCNPRVVSGTDAVAAPAEPCRTSVACRNCEQTFNPWAEYQPRVSGYCPSCGEAAPDPSPPGPAAAPLERTCSRCEWAESDCSCAPPPPAKPTHVAVGHAWRVGRKLGRTLYRDGECVGIVDTPELAAAIVAALGLAAPVETLPPANPSNEHDHRAYDPCATGPQTMPRPNGCQCHQEVGDSPCRVHGDDAAAAPAETPPTERAKPGERKWCGRFPGDSCGDSPCCRESPAAPAPPEPPRECEQWCGAAEPPWWHTMRCSPECRRQGRRMDGTPKVDRVPTEAEGQAAVERLGINVHKWAEETNERVAAAIADLPAETSRRSHRLEALARVFEGAPEREKSLIDLLERVAAPAPGAGEGPRELTFAEAMALDPSEVEARLNCGVGEWQPLDKNKWLSLAALRASVFRRAGAARARSQAGAGRHAGRGGGQVTWLDRILATACPTCKCRTGLVCGNTDIGGWFVCASRIQAAATGRPWWVHFGNYFPREVNSTWPTREEAEKRRDELNDQSDDGMWECEEAG